MGIGHRLPWLESRNIARTRWRQSETASMGGATSNCTRNPDQRGLMKMMMPVMKMRLPRKKMMLVRL